MKVNISLTAVMTMVFIDFLCYECGRKLSQSESEPDRLSHPSRVGFVLKRDSQCSHAGETARNPFRGLELELFTPADSGTEAKP